MTETKEKRPVDQADLFRLKALGSARLSPDGKKAVYSVTTTDAEKLEDHSALWLVDLESGQERQLTAGTSSDSGPEWSPDGKKIAFLSSRGGSPQIYVIPVDGGEALPLTDLKKPIGAGPSWSPDGKFLAFTAGPEMDPPPDPSKPYRVTRHVYRFNGMGLVAPIVQDVYVVSAEGGEPKQLTSDDWMAANLRWSPDGQEILYTAGFDPDSHDINSELRVVDMQGKSRTLVGRDWGDVNLASWVPDGRIIFAGQVKDQPLGTKTDLWVIKRRGSQPENRTAGIKPGVCGGLQPDSLAGGEPFVRASSDSSKVYVTVHSGGEIGLYEVALQGAESFSQVLGGERSVHVFDTNEEIFLYGVAHLNQPMELFCSALDGKDEKQLTFLNKEVLDEWLLPEIEHIFFEGAEGVEIEGWVMKPTTGIEAPYPTILYIHGGPTGAFGQTFSFDFQMLAGAGYAVLFINPQGSSGYGTEFATAIFADWGNRDYRDLMAGLDLIIEKGIADADRLGVSGISYGGYMSSWILGQTDRFKAGIPENPVTNLFSQYGTSDVSVWLCEAAFGGKPYEIPDVYRKCSPITYAHNCTTPTLLIQGEADYRCPIGQSEEFYTTLKANGCVVEMLRFPNSSHTMSINGAPLMRKTQNEEILKWMNRYVLGQTPEA